MDFCRVRAHSHISISSIFKLIVCCFLGFNFKAYLLFFVQLQAWRVKTDSFLLGLKTYKAKKKV